jgi:dTDP-4-dehydrorhamnose 3,5-epimerase
LPDVLIIEPDSFEDERGYFFEIYQKNRYVKESIDTEFIQDNLSFSIQGTLRGIHYQYPQQQAKLIQVLQGEIFDIAVDIRQGSPFFGQWTGFILSEKNKRQIFIPEGFAHGFCVTSDTAFCLYKCNNFYAPDDEQGILWSDPDLAIDWPVRDPVLSPKDTAFGFLKDIPKSRLPVYGGASI